MMALVGQALHCKSIHINNTAVLQETEVLVEAQQWGQWGWQKLHPALFHWIGLLAGWCDHLFLGDPICQCPMIQEAKMVKTEGVGVRKARERRWWCWLNDGGKWVDTLLWIRNWLNVVTCHVPFRPQTRFPFSSRLVPTSPTHSRSFHMFLASPDLIRPHPPQTRIFPKSNSHCTIARPLSHLVCPYHPYCSVPL